MWLLCFTFNSFKQTVHCIVSEFLFSKYFHTELFGRSLTIFLNSHNISALSKLSLETVTKLSALLLSHITVENNFTKYFPLIIRRIFNLTTGSDVCSWLRSAEGIPPAFVLEFEYAPRSNSYPDTWLAA